MVAPQAYYKDSELEPYIRPGFSLAKWWSIEIKEYLFASEKTTNANSPPWERSNPILMLSWRLSPTRGPSAVIISVLITIKPANSENTFGHSRIRSCIKQVDMYKEVKEAQKQRSSKWSTQEVMTKLNGLWNFLHLWVVICNNYLLKQRQWEITRIIEKIRGDKELPTWCQIYANTCMSIEVPVVTKNNPRSKPLKGLMSASICVR